MILWKKWKSINIYNIKYLFSTNIQKSGFRIQIARLNYYTSTKLAFNASKHVRLTTRFDIFFIGVVLFGV